MASKTMMYKLRTRAKRFKKRSTKTYERRENPKHIVQMIRLSKRLKNTAGCHVWINPDGSTTTHYNLPPSASPSSLQASMLSAVVAATTGAVDYARAQLKRTLGIVAPPGRPPGADLAAAVRRAKGAVAAPEGLSGLALAALTPQQVKEAAERLRGEFRCEPLEYHVHVPLLGSVVFAHFFLHTRSLSLSLRLLLRGLQSG